MSCKTVACAEHRKEHNREYYRKNRVLIRKKQKKFYLKNRLRIRAHQNRAYGKHGRLRETWKKSNLAYKLRNPHKIKARRAVSNAIRDGKLKRKGCEHCGRRAEAHHTDYSKPLEIRWLCRKHHNQVHTHV